MSFLDFRELTLALVFTCMTASSNLRLGPSLFYFCSEFQVLTGPFIGHCSTLFSVIQALATVILKIPLSLFNRHPQAPHSHLPSFSTASFLPCTIAQSSPYVIAQAQDRRDASPIFLSLHHPPFAQSTCLICVHPSTHLSFTHFPSSHPAILPHHN